jgi:AAA domain-containing protein
VRVAVSGSHNTGKSTLIATFVDLRPEYRYEPEAYETLADDVPLDASEGPSPEGLQSLLDYTIAAIGSHAADTSVVFERSPIDYLAYASACRDAWSGPRTRDFLAAAVPAVRAALRHLDLIAMLPVSDAIRPRPDEDERFRKRVDERLRRALIDDDFDLFDDRDLPRVVELSPLPARQIAELMRLTEPEK